MPGADLSLLNSVLDNLVIKMVPMENLNGCKHVEAGEFCERRNGRGVDLNRNWGVDWGKKEKDYDPYEENPGAGPFSEPETQIMRKLSQSFDPHVWVNVHSGMEALFMPYDHKNVTPDGIISHLMRSLLDNLNHHHCQNRCLVGSGGGSVGYLAHGTSTDYMHDIVKVPMAFTFEHHTLSMTWFSITTTMVITLWVSSLLRVLLASSPCIPSSPAFLSAGSSATKNRRNALLVVAHPDDESMFFAPTLLYLASEGHNVHVLCLSTGNADGKGNIRKKEFYRACAILKVPLQQVQILDHPKLQYFQFRMALINHGTFNYWQNLWRRRSERELLT